MVKCIMGTVVNAKINMESQREEIPKDDNLLPTCTKPKNSFFQSFSPPANAEMSSDIFNVDFTTQQTENLSESVL